MSARGRRKSAAVVATTPTPKKAELNPSDEVKKEEIPLKTPDKTPDKKPEKTPDTTVSTEKKRKRGTAKEVDNSNKITKSEFIANAKPLKLDINGIELAGEPKVFSKGVTFGWTSRKRAIIEVNGQKLNIAINTHFIVLDKKAEDPVVDEEQ